MSSLASFYANADHGHPPLALMQTIDRSSQALANWKNESYKQSISKRETQIIELVSLEFSTKEIALKLFISRETVNTHRKNIMRKLNVRNSAGMIRRSFECGYLNIETTIS